MVAACPASRRWPSRVGSGTRCRSTLFGRQVAPLLFTAPARWYGALRDQPVRISVVRDPRGRRRDETVFCTDLSVGAACILEASARRWTLEVAFHAQQQFLGFEDPHQQTPQAVLRTAPLAGIVYDLVLLWSAGRVRQGLASGWVVRPWYRSKTAPSFLDMLTAVRQASWQRYVSAPPCPAPRTQNPVMPWTDAVLATA